MKSPYLTLISTPGAFAISTILLFGAPLGLSAKDKSGYSLGDVPQIINSIVRGAGQSAPVTAVRSIPGYAVAMGNGYAGRGYYYGPANTRYYEQRQGVRYYSTYEEVPREYYSNEQRSSSGYYREANSVGASVQQALARNGYYNGPVDGQIGPKSRRSIAAYQQDHGLAVTGNINSALMASLGL